MDSFLADSRAALRAGYEASARALTAAGVPFTPASAGMFVWLDLRQLLPQEQAAFADERNLWQAMIDTEGVRLVLTPGEACCCSEPGFFRLVRCGRRRDTNSGCGPPGALARLPRVGHDI